MILFSVRVCLCVRVGVREHKNMLMTLWVNANFCIANGFNLAKRAIVSLHTKNESNGV